MIDSPLSEGAVAPPFQHWVASFAREGLSSFVRRGLASSGAVLGRISQRRNTTGSPTPAFQALGWNVQFEAQEGDLEATQDAVAYAEGYALVGERIVKGRDLTSLLSRSAKAGPYPGNYTSLLFDRDAVFASSDETSQGAVFYALEGRRLILGNSFDDVRRCLGLPKKHREHVNTSELERIATISIGWTDETLDKRVKLVPFGQRLKWDGRTVAFETCCRPFDTAGTYKDAIEEAAELVIRWSHATLDAAAGTQPVLWLSGGLDSRIVLAGLLRAGVSKEFRYHTYGSAASFDRQMARQLRSDFGLEFYPGSRVYSFSTFEDLLKHNARGNIAFRSFVAPLRMPDRITAMNGASGETMRSVFPKQIRFSKFGLTEESAANGTYIQAFGATHLLAEDVRERQRERMRSFIDQLPGADLIDRLDYAQLAQRNRFHFGLGARYGKIEHPTYSSTNGLVFFRAGRYLDPNSRMEGKAVFDLIDKLAPELNSYEVEGRNWLENASANRKVIRPTSSAARDQSITLKSKESDEMRREMAARQNVEVAAFLETNTAGRILNVERFRRRLIAHPSGGATESMRKRVFHLWLAHEAALRFEH